MITARIRKAIEMMKLIAPCPECGRDVTCYWSYQTRHWHVSTSHTADGTPWAEAPEKQCPSRDKPIFFNVTFTS